MQSSPLFLNNRLKVAVVLLPALAMLSLVYNMRAIRLGPIPYGSGAMEILLIWGFVVNLSTFAVGYLWWVPRWLAHRKVLPSLLDFLWPAPVAVVLKMAMVWAVFEWTDADREVLHEIIVIIPPSYGIFAWGLVALGGGARFAEAWLVEQNLRRALELQRTRAELAQLKQQVNPHFLFNTLNNLYALAQREDASQTGEAILKLSDMMRFLLHEVDHDTVALERELGYLRAYIELQKLRLPSNLALDLELSVSGDPTPVQVPPMMLMTLVENAFKHGISFKAPSPITMQVAIHDGRATFTVRNRIHATKQRLEAENGGFGLANLTERLAWYSNGPAALTYGEQDDWFEAVLVLPKADEMAPPEPTPTHKRKVATP